MSNSESGKCREVAAREGARLGATDGVSRDAAQTHGASAAARTGAASAVEETGSVPAPVEVAVEGAVEDSSLEVCESLLVRKRAVVTTGLGLSRMLGVNRTLPAGESHIRAASLATVLASLKLLQPMAAPALPPLQQPLYWIARRHNAR